MKRKPRFILLLFVAAALCGIGGLFAACSSETGRSAEEYTLSVADIAGGDIIVYVNGRESHTAREGDGVRVALKAETGYTYVQDSFTVNSRAKAFSFSMPTENLVLSAEFEKIIYTVSGASYEYGTVTPSVTQAAYGDEFSVTVTPKNSVCAVVRRTLRMNGAVLDRSTRYEETEYTVTMPNCDVAFSAEFVSLISLAGEGTEESPWLIGTAEEFVEFSAAVSEYGFAVEGTYFKLIDDISVSDESFTGVGKASGDELNPESAVGAAFGGVFDGDGHTIAVNLTGANFVGVFRANTGTIKNLTVAGTVTGGGKNAGGIVAYNYGGRIENCVNKAVLSSTATAPYHFGGIAGFSYGGVISGCINLAPVNASGHTFGGIAGYAGYGATIENCTNGSADDASQGAVSGKYELGGIAAYLGTASSVEGQTLGNVIRNCTNYAAIGGTSYAVGGIVGTVVSNNEVFGSVNYGAVSSSQTSTDKKGGVGGVAGTIYAATVSQCDNYGTLSNGGLITGGVVGMIYTASAGTSAAVIKSNNYRDISVATGYVGGIVGYAGASNATMVITVSECNNGSAETPVSITGKYYVGGIFGCLGTTANTADHQITNCNNYGNITATGHITVSSINSARAGGIAGMAYGDISSCASYGKVTAAEYGVSAGAQAGDKDNYRVGYIVGYQTSACVLTDCVNGALSAGAEGGEE